MIRVTQRHSSSLTLVCIKIYLL